MKVLAGPSSRRDIRQYTKSELATTARVLFDERQQLLAASAWRWKRKRLRAVILAFVAGAIWGFVLARAFGA